MRFCFTGALGCASLPFCNKEGEMLIDALISAVPTLLRKKTVQSSCRLCAPSGNINSASTLNGKDKSLTQNLWQAMERTECLLELGLGIAL